MLKKGTILYHWRYGMLNVEELESWENNTYIHTRVVDLKGVIEDSNYKKMKLIKSEEKIFTISDLDKCLHQSKDAAIFLNENRDGEFPENLRPVGDKQGQNPLGMVFPIDGALFHSIYKNVIDERSKIKKEKKSRNKQLEIEKNGVENSLKKINSDLEKFFKEYKNAFMELVDLKDKKTIIKKYKNENKIEGNGDKFLDHLFNECSYEGFDWNDSYKEFRDKEKKEIKNDTEFNSSVKVWELVLDQLVEVEKENIKLIPKKIEEILKINKFPEINDLLNRYKKNLNLIKSSDIDLELTKAKENYKADDKKNLKDQLKEKESEINSLQKILERIDILNDKRYVINI